jgi:tetratricopeptide (TPR) repeat protein
MLAVSAAQAALEHVGRSQKRDAHAVAELAAAVRIVASRPGFLQADGAAFDNACMCVAGYTRAMLSAMKRGTWAATAAGVDFPTSSDALAAAAYLRECSQAVLAVNIHDAAVASTLRTSACAVSALNALLRVAHDGDAAVAASLLDGVVGGENDVRLALALTAELKNRVAAPLLGAEKISHEVEGLYQQASAAFEASFSPQTGEGAVQMPQGEAVAPREAYCSVLLSFAATYQDMPRAQPADRAFPESMRVSQSHVYIPPAAAVSAPSAITGIECPPVRARKVAVMCLDRALRINRKLYPEDRNNLKATALLRGLGCCYADAKDYIYATGMFNSALRAVEANFGRVSEEYLEVLRLQEHTQRRLKNDKEADATAHTITVLADDVSKIE